MCVCVCGGGGETRLKELLCKVCISLVHCVCAVSVGVRVCLLCYARYDDVQLYFRETIITRLLL